jgi:Protein of unknown function (DUF1571)
MRLRIIFMITALCIPTILFAADASLLLRKSMTNVRSLNSCQYTFESYERINGKMFFTKALFKISADPLRIYMYQFAPDKGIEILYLKGKNSGNARVYPGGFPWKILNLNPYGSLALKNRHHPITHAGFEYTALLIQYPLDKYKSENPRLITIEGSDQVHGADCYKLVLKNPAYQMTTYKTSMGETVLSIASKLKLNYTTIQENNPSITAASGLGTIPANTVLTVPNDYASGMEVFIRKNDLFPVRFKIYDAKGLFEDYSFYDVKPNPAFNDIDFSETNPEYGFD